MAATEAKSPARDINLALANLRKALESLKNRDPKLFTESNIKIAAHLRKVTGGKFFNLPQYHAAETQFVSDEDKFQMYKLFFNALIVKPGPDYSKFEAPTETPIVPEERPASIQSAKSMTSPTTVEKVTPPVQHVKLEKTQEWVEPARGQNEGPVIHAEGLVKELIKLIAPHLKLEVDEQAIELVARRVTTEFQVELDKSFHDRVQKAMLNGAFPEDRVKQVVNALRPGDMTEEKVREIVSEQLESFKAMFSKQIGTVIAESLGVNLKTE